MKVPRVNWIAIGKKLKDDKKVHRKENIDVFEFVEDTDEEAEKEAGVPINATLAVDLIRRFWKDVKPEEFTDVSAVGREKESGATTPDKGVNKDDKEQLTKQINELTERAVRAEFLLDKLARSTFAITFDKSVILKTLSQPGCEKIRFYLCANAKGLEKEEEKNRLFSLVVVGVDSNSYDLLYQYEDAQHTSRKIIDRSLVDEYGLNASILSFKSDEESVKPYTLFRYALNKKP